MPRQRYSAGTGYRRLPRTILITILASVGLVTIGVHITQWRARRTEYLKLVARFDELTDRYAQRSRSDAEGAELAAGEIPNLEDLARAAATDDDPVQVSLKRMIETKRRDAKRLQADARKWAEVEKYYASMRRQYDYAASHPWWIATSLSGDALDVEFVFLSDQTP